MKNHKVNHKEMHNNDKPYFRLLLMTLLSFVAMYFLMYAMVDSLPNVYSSFNQFYMAGLMSAPMIIIELTLMRAMYMNKRLNVFILVGSVVALVGFFALIRQQTAITDKQFLRSMIPHHAGAILMCEQSSVQNPAIVALCKNINASQTSEIEQMKVLLQELEK